MSWDEYITSLTAEGNGILEAAICGREDGLVWAASPMFKGITSDQIKVVAAKPQNGTLTLAGVKALVLKKDDDDEIINLVTMKNAETDQSSPLVIGYSIKAMVIGLGKSESRSVGIHVEKTAKHLRESKY